MMNAALIAACAVNATNTMHENGEPMHVYYEEQKVDLPIIGMIKVLNNCDITVLDDFSNGGVELRFRSASAVDDLIRKLQNLKSNMLVLEGE